MNTRRGLAVAMLLLVTPAVASARPTFAAFEGASSVAQGNGAGKLKVFRGIDWWFSGEPARKYQRLGTITDIRADNGRADVVTGSSDIAKLVVAKGGNAVIVASQETQKVPTPPVINTFSGQNYGSTVAPLAPSDQINTTLVVIKYVEK